MIFNTVVSGGGSKINGETKSYLATADIAKGDFVQLTTKGVEEVAFSHVLTLDTYKDVRYVSAAILSPTLAVITFIEKDAAINSSSTSYTCNVCAQPLYYENGAWAAGTKLVIASYTGAASTIVNVCRLSEDKAMLIYTATLTENSGIYILEVSADSVTVENSRLDINKFYSGAAASTAVQMVSVALTSDTVVMVHYSYGTNNASRYVYPWVITYKNSTISAQRLATLGSNPFTLSVCKLNDQTALVSKVGSSSDYVENYQIIIVEGESATMVDSGISAGSYTQSSSSKVIRLRENVAIAPEYGGVTPEDSIVNLLEYDPDTGVLTRSDAGIATDGEYWRWEGHKMSDSEVIVLASEVNYPEDSSDPLCLAVIDTEAKTCTTKIAPISAEGKERYYNLTYADYGWMIAFSGTTSVLVAPLVSQTTAAPYADRIDGVANNSVSAGQTAEVIVP